MDVVLRTSYGEAEISLRNTNDRSTLADVVKYVTGQHSPPIVFVDGRALPATTSLRASGMLHGSTVATSEREEAANNSVVEIVQIAGRGAGTSASLPAGRFVLGSGRRTNAPELDFAPVDHPSFEIVVEDDGAVSIEARSGNIRLDGREIDSSDNVQWLTGTLDSGDRVFQLIRRVTTATGQQIRQQSSTARGLVPFNRPRRSAPPPEADPITSSEKDEIVGHHGAERDRRRSEQPHIGDLIQLSSDSDPTLWERRPGDDDVFQVAVGLADLEWSPRLHTARDDRAEARRLVEQCGPLPMVPVSVDLAADGGIAIIGRPEFTSSLARGLMLGAAVTHGPADLDIIVLTSSERMHAWEWSKWLPHTRSTEHPYAFSTEEDVRTWVDALETMPNHLTLVVVDDAALWRDRDAPLRPLFSKMQPSLHLLVLADLSDGPPAVCSAVITEDDNLSMSIEWIQERRRIGGIRPFLTSVDIATEVALTLAPLDDPELAAQRSNNLAESGSLFDLLGLDRIDASEFIERWSNDGDKFSTVVGLSAQKPVTIDLVDDGPHGLIAGKSADDVLRTLIAGLAANCAPSELSFILFNFTEGASLSDIRKLPHTVWAGDGLDTRVTSRMLKCLSAEVARRVADDTESEFPHLLLGVDQTEVTDTKVPEFLTEIVAISNAGREVGIHLVVATGQPEGPIDPEVEGAFNFRIDPDAIQIARLDQPHRTTAKLDILPFVVGRELSPMEHRLNRVASSADDQSAEPQTSPALSEMAAAMTRAAAEMNTPPLRTICPDLLPLHLSLRSFFDDHPGDGIPFALVDIPDEQRQEPAWWRPEFDGGLLIVGAEGSGKTSLLRSLALGIGERYSADDLHIYCIDGSDHGLDHLAKLPHTGEVTHGDDREATARLTGALQRELDRRIVLRDDGGTQRPGPDHPTIVAMVDQIDGLRDIASTFQQILDHGQSVNMHAVITSDDPNGFAASVTAKNVGRVTLDMSDSPIIDHPLAGRAHRGDGSEMQLVVPPSDIAETIVDLGVESAGQRPSLEMGD